MARRGVKSPSFRATDSLYGPRRTANRMRVVEARTGAAFCSLLSARTPGNRLAHVASPAFPGFETEGRPCKRLLAPRDLIARAVCHSQRRPGRVRARWAPRPFAKWTPGLLSNSADASQSRELPRDQVRRLLCGCQVCRSQA